MTRSVLVTGASTGIGRATAVRLEAEGMQVFAGVRREEDGESLRAAAGPRLRPIIVDVADEASVETAAATVREALDGGRLLGIVNNAGIAVGGPVEFTTREQWRQQFEVNLFGAVTVIQRFLPLLRESRGRIVNVSSVGGRFSQPFVAPYVASKHALEALSDALRIELRPWRIQVSLIEPGAVATPIWSKGVAQAQTISQSAPPRALELYGAVIKRMTQVARRESERGIPPARVAEAVYRALTAPRPRTRYVVGTDTRAMLALRRWLPDRWRDEVIVRYARLPR